MTLVRRERNGVHNKPLGSVWKTPLTTHQPTKKYVSLFDPMIIYYKMNYRIEMNMKL